MGRERQYAKVEVKTTAIMTKSYDSNDDKDDSFDSVQ